MTWGAERAAIAACALVLCVDVIAAAVEGDWRHAVAGSAALVWLGLNVSDDVDVV